MPPLMDGAMERYAQTALDIVERYRECRNLLGGFADNLSALENFSTQKGSLGGAVRRRAPLQPPHEDATAVPAHGSKATWLQGGADAAPHFSCRTERIAATPLGVLTAFGAFFTEDLLGQLQYDQGELLRALSSVAQTWQQKTSAVAQLVATLDAAGEQDGYPSMEPGSTAAERRSLGAQGRKADAASRKAKLKQAADALYGNATHAASAYPEVSALPVASGNPAPALLHASSTVCARLTGLPSLGHLQLATHAMLSVLVKMGSILQESVLALRTDMLNTSRDGRLSASILREFLQRETALGDTPESVGGTAAPAPEALHARFLQNGTEPLPFLEALSALRESLEDLWDAKCEQRFLVEEARILLAS